MILQLHNYPVTADGQDRGAQSADEYLVVARLMRWILLNESDWIMGNDSPVDSETQNEWRVWRQQIRDLPTTFPSPMTETIEAPDPPVAYRPESWVHLTPAADWNRNITHTHGDDTEPHSH